MDDEEEIKKEIMGKVEELYRLRKSRESSSPGDTRINYAGRVFDEMEMKAAVDSVLDFRFTLGPKGKEFCEKFSKFMGMRYCLVTNSGSSSNLIAVAVLTSSNIKLPLKPGDEVITPAMTFPTTLNPIIQYHLIPVFIDIEEDTYNIDASKIENAISDNTRAIMVPHTLGNPAEMDKIIQISKEYHLYVIEDTCDALGSRYDGRLCGTFGDISTCSFYAAHHMTMGEGGAVLTNNLELYKTALSIRDWGRACFCMTGEEKPDGACGHRFDFRFPGMPDGYDHKYIYSNIGYNLKPLDMQCAIGIEQLKKLPDFIEKRKSNFDILYDTFKKYREKLILPRSLPKGDPSWFAFPVAVREHAGFDRSEFIKYLEDKKIETRMMFSGNIIKHPGYRNVEYRISGTLCNTESVLRNAFFLGVYPGLSSEKLGYMVDVIEKFLSAVG